MNTDRHIETGTEKRKNIGAIGHIVIAFLIAALIFVLLSRFGFSLSKNPFQLAEAFQLPAQAVMDDGRLYVLDNSSMRVSCIEDGKYIWRLDGGESSVKSFYKAQSIWCDGGGVLYVHNIEYDPTGAVVIFESIQRYSLDGVYEKDIYSAEYSDKTGPLNSGNICDIAFDGDTVIIAQKSEDGITMIRVDASGSLTSVLYPSNHVMELITDSAIDGDTFYYASKVGGLYKLTGDSEELVWFDDDFTETSIGTIVSSIDIFSNGDIAVSDIGQRTIRRITPDGRETIVVSNSGGTSEGILVTPIRYPVFVTSDDRIVTTDSEIIEIFDTEGNYTPISEAALPVSDVIIGISGWACLLFMAICAIYFVTCILKKVLGGPERNSAVLGIVGAVIVIVSSVLVGFMAVSTANNNTDAEFQKNVSYISHLMTSQINGDYIDDIKSPADIESDSYKKLREDMDHYINASLDVDYGLYYTLYHSYEGVPCIVMDSDGVYPAIYPIDTMDNYDDIYVRGEYSIVAGFEDAYGIWYCAAGPIRNSSGEIVALLEIGINMYTFSTARSAETLELVLSVCALIVLIMFLLTEGINFSAYLSRRKVAKLIGKRNFEGSESILRIIMFLLFAAQSMQDSFISVLALKMYEPIFGLPQSIGGALPITVEMLMIAIFSIVGGHLLGKFKIKSVMTCSFVVAIIGYVIAALSPNFYVLLIGKTIIGIGVGVVYTAINTAVTYIPQSRSEGAFAMVNSGMLTGGQTGVVVGAYLYSWFSYNGAYAASAVVALLGMLCVVKYVTRDQFVDSREHSDDTQAERSSISTLKFISNRKTLSFLLLIIIPTLLAVAFFEYYFPIFGDANGLSETRIGQVLLVYGLSAIYTGPALTKLLLKRFGAKISVLFASLVFSAALLLFIITPSTSTMLLIALAFGLITGFSYSVQSEYFSHIESIADYGEGKAMGLYSMFQSISQSFAPVLIGYMCMTGLTAGTIITAIVVAASGLAFTVITIDRRDHGKNREKAIKSAD